MEEKERRKHRVIEVLRDVNKEESFQEKIGRCERTHGVERKVTSKIKMGVLMTGVQDFILLKCRRVRECIRL